MPQSSWTRAAGEWLGRACTVERLLGALALAVAMGSGCLAPMGADSVQVPCSCPACWQVATRIGAPTSPLAALDAGTAITAGSHNRPAVYLPGGVHRGGGISRPASSRASWRSSARPRTRRVVPR